MFIILQGEMREKDESNRFYVKDGGPSLIGFLCDFFGRITRERRGYFYILTFSSKQGYLIHQI